MSGEEEKAERNKIDTSHSPVTVHLRSLPVDTSKQTKFILTHVNISEHIRAMKRRVINTRYFSD